jgi:exodeoxyribonuclease-3
MNTKFHKVNTKKMKIFSYNVNGIRAAMTKGLVNWLEVESPDIICLQETKASPEQIDLLTFETMGYSHYWYSAKKKGYSGVAIFSKIKPKAISMGMNIGKYDDEGRILMADFHDFTLLSIYFPSGTTGDIRQKFKMQFLHDLSLYIKKLLKEKPNLVLSGDYNICHKPIDINFPNKHTKMSGFLPEEREWMDSFLALGFIDSFREFNSKPDQYSWWSYRAGSRAKNLGWRIDYHMVSIPLRSKLVNAGIMQKVNHSDHCPVWVELDFK